MLRRSRGAASALAAALLLAGCTMTSPMAGGPAATTGDGASPRPVTEVLSNGLTLVTQEQRSSDIVAVYLWVGTGVRFETPDGLGYAHFQEHMLFKGTDTFGPGYIDRTVEGQGGRSNAFTSFDYTTFQILVPSEGTRKAFELLEAMAFRSAFEPKEIDAERQVIFEESRIETDTPKSAIIRQLYGLVFPDHPYGRPVLGTPQTMSAANQAKLKAFNTQYYTPENMVLVVVGPIDAKQARTLADATFGRRPKTSYAPSPTPSLAPLKGIVCKTVDRPEQQAQLALGWQAPSLSNPDSFALDLVATILGGSESARLQRTLRDGERLVSGINVANASMSLSGIFYVHAQLEPADVEKVKARILEELGRLETEGPTEEERQLAVTRAESEHAFSYETAGGVATAYGTAQLNGTLEDELRYVDRLRAVTRDQIRDVARKYLPLTDYACIAFAPGNK
ncbi:MAG TPA: pitrilysin family protein [Methylomirabilota bacterium]|jgi:zinc protease|nr:pitrilysin family protein [Methylomirabilota bacterium]